MAGESVRCNAFASDEFGIVQQHLITVRAALAVAFAAVVDENLMRLSSQLSLSGFKRFSRCTQKMQQEA